MDLSARNQLKDRLVVVSLARFMRKLVLIRRQHVVSQLPGTLRGLNLNRETPLTVINIRRPGHDRANRIVRRAIRHGYCSRF